jgi:hypothetical protein
MGNRRSGGGGNAKRKKREKKMLSLLFCLGIWSDLVEVNGKFFFWDDPPREY